MRKCPTSNVCYVAMIFAAFFFSLIVHAASPVAFFDYAYVSSYDPVVRGNYIVTNMPTLLSVRALNTSTSSVKQATLKWKMFVNVPKPNGTFRSMSIATGNVKWKKGTAGNVLSLQQDITAKLLKKLTKKTILYSLVKGEMHGELRVSLKGALTDKSKLFAITVQPVTFNLDHYVFPGTVDTMRIVDSTGATITDSTERIIITVPTNAVTEPTIISVVKTTMSNGISALSIQSDKPLNGTVSLQFNDDLQEASAAAQETRSSCQEGWPAVRSWNAMWIYFRVGYFASTFRCNYSAGDITFNNIIAEISTYVDTGARLHCSTSNESEMRGKTPILFIHGYSSDILGNIIYLGGENGIPGGDTFGDLSAMLKDRFGDNIILYDFRYNSNARFQDIAGDLKQAVDYISVKAGRRIHIIAHSFGGLVARTFLQSLALGWNGAALPDYDTARNNVASFVTVGTPHSGIRDTAGQMHGVTFPKGQDAFSFELARQLSVHQAGEQVGGLMQVMPLVRVSQESGEIPAELTKSEKTFPNQLPVYVLIGITSDRGGNDTYIDEGDALISFQGQRFLHDGGTANPLIRSSRLGAMVTEQILGRPEGVLTMPGDANPWSPRSNDWWGYRHTAAVGILALRTAARNEVDLDGQKDGDHATYLNIVAWLSKFIGQYAISGQVSGNTQQGVTMILSTGPITTTGSSGEYSFTGLLNGNYTVTPSKSGYSFLPPSRYMTIAGANETGKDFTATLIGDDITSGLVAYYPLNGDANDASGNGNNGTPSALLPTADRFNRSHSAYLFDGTNGEIVVQHSSTLDLNAFTIALWIKPSRLNYTQAIFNKGAVGEDASVNVNYLLELAVPNYLSFLYESSSGGNYELTSPNIIETGQWYFVAITRKATDGQRAMYLNGQMIDISTNTVVPATQTQPVRIGWSVYDVAEQHFCGKMDEIRLYNRALTSSEVTKLYNDISK